MFANHLQLLDPLWSSNEQLTLVAVFLQNFSFGCGQYSSQGGSNKDLFRWMLVYLMDEKVANPESASAQGSELNQSSRGEKVSSGFPFKSTSVLPEMIFVVASQRKLKSLSEQL